MKNAKGWFVLAIATSINLLLGVLYAWSVVGKGLINELGWSITEASWPYTVCTVVFALVMIGAGQVQDALGPRFAALTGSLLLGAGLTLSGFFTSPGPMVATFGLLVGSGLAFCYAATTPTAMKWFPANQKGMISGIVVGGVGFAAVYISPLTNFLIASRGISHALIILGSICFTAAGLLSLFLFTPNSEQARAIRNRAGWPPAPHPVGLGFREMMHRRSFYQLWFMFAFSSSAGLMLIGHLASIAKVQAAWENGYLLVVLLAVFNTLGRLLGGYGSDRIGHQTAMKIAFLGQAINMLGFAFFRDTLMLAIGTAMAGLCYGSLLALFPVAAAENYGTRNLGQNYGVIYTAWGFGGILGPVLAARIMQATGSFSASYLCSAVLLAAALGLAFTYSPEQSPA